MKTKDVYIDKNKYEDNDKRVKAFTRISNNVICNISFRDG